MLDDIGKRNNEDLRKMESKVEKESLPSHVARLNGLDAQRSKRIYGALSKLSDNAISALKNKDMRSFSIYTDKMRPLMNYIINNSVTLSDHLLADDIKKTGDYELLVEEIKDFVPKLRKNLKIIDDARNAVSAIPFGPHLFSSQEITDAYLDHLLPLVWNFEFDAIILINLGDARLLDYLLARGQKRFFLIGSSLDENIIRDKLYKEGIFFWAYKDGSIIRDMFLSVPGVPPTRFISIDCGVERQDPKKTVEMLEKAQQGRIASWHRFNTINRADAVKVLDNLYNLVNHMQISEFNGKFKGIPAIIVSPGPSLKKNISVLKKFKGKALIVCVLRALGTLLNKNIEPDIVIQVDPHNLKTMYTEWNGTKSNLWEEWLEKNDTSKIKMFVSSVYSHPDIFGINVQNFCWMNPSVDISDYLPLKMFQYKRAGGSVSHSAFDMLVEFGCSSIALIGQDLAYSKNNDVYIETAATHKKGDEVSQQKFGDDIECKGFDGKTVLTNNVFLNFARLFNFFAEELSEDHIKLFNCTEGGLFIEGFNHCKLEEFLKTECVQSVENKLQELFKEHKNGIPKVSKSYSNMMKFIGKNLLLCEEIALLLKKLRPVIQKAHKLEEDLVKFDKLQNKIIKKMGLNEFYTFALQKDTHILQSGLRAENSIDNQIGFHEDFLKAVEIVNDRFYSSLQKQRELFRSKNQ